MRDLRLIAYFRQCLPREFPVFCFDDLVQGFGSIHPFRLPLSKIHVIDLHCQVTFYYHFTFILIVLFFLKKTSNCTFFLKKTSNCTSV